MNDGEHKGEFMTNQQAFKKPVGFWGPQNESSISRHSRATSTRQLRDFDQELVKNNQELVVGGHSTRHPSSTMEAL